jgi:AraC-like DNA-binding protein
MAILRWPLRALPAIHSAGRYPLGPREEAHRYLNHSTIALHQYEYSGEIHIGRERFPLRPGDVTLTPAGVESFYNLPAPGHHLCIHFFPSRDMGGHVRVPLWIRLGSESTFVTQQIWSVTEMHRRAFNPGKPGAAAASAASAALQALLLWLHLFEPGTANAVRPARTELALQRLNTLVEKRFTEPLTVPSIAREVGLSQNYLARFFRKRYGMTIPRYLLVRRIDLARHLLLTSDDLVKQIAGRVGLPDPQYFNKQFRRLTGSNPSDFRLSEKRRTGAP